MAILPTILLLALRQVTWPVATSDNGFGQYLAAAHMVETPYWKNFENVQPRKRTLASLRDEAAHAGPILEALRKGNSMEVYDPCKPETLLTLHPEYAAFRRLTRIALAVAKVKAKDGDLESASDWLIQADQFVHHLPTPLIVSLLVKQAMLVQLTRSTEELLPLFGPRQLKQQLNELQFMARHPVDVEATLETSRRATDLSIPITVADPASLGYRDNDAPDVASALNKIMQVPEMTEEFKKVLKKIMGAAPKEAQNDPTTGLKYLADAQDQVPPEHQAAYKKFVEALRAAFKPQPYNLPDYAKTLDEPSKAHAAKVVELFLEPMRASMAAAFRRPERTWWLDWKPKSDSSLNDQMMKDGRAGQFVGVDMFAMRVGQEIQPLAEEANDDPTALCRRFLLDRENLRLAAIDAEIWSFKAANHRLPMSLKQIGNPLDPLSGKPYLYRRISSSQFELAAIGIPGIGRIDLNPKKMSSLYRLASPD